MRACLFLICAASMAQVPFERIAQADKEPGNWLTYSRNLQGHRYSPLAEITTANVKDLKVQWVYQFETTRNEVSPIVIDGILYITGPNTAAALDGRTGRTLWEWKRNIPADYRSIGFGRVNRGPAVLDSTLYVTTLDCYLVALDLKSGSQKWATKVADYKLGYSMTLAPLAIKGKVVIGTSGGEAGIRGFVDAYDSKTGERAWRFYTIPGKEESGVETWAGESYRTGGGSTWVTGAYDPDLNTVYWGVGNPSPDWNGDKRLGDNLYTCSLVALDGETGKRKWHFQFTPHDTHDWDSAHVPMLYEAEVRGKKRSVVAIANRNAFFYVLDRKSGEFLAGRSYAKQTWARGLDDKGRPMVIPGTDPSEKGTLLWPNLNGATVWFSPSYSPDTKLVYVSTREAGAVYYKRDQDFQEGTFFAGGGEEELHPDDTWGAIRALDSATGEMRWEFRLLSPPWAGVMATGGGLVFSGSQEGNFYALDARSGKPLWDFQTGGNVTANPVSFIVDGKQRIAVCANRVMYVFGL